MDASSYLQYLKQDAEAAKAAELDYRREATRRIAGLEEQRAFAFRRLNLMQAIIQAIAPDDSEEIAVANALATLRSRLGWVGDSEARDEFLEQFTPVAVALARATARQDGADIAGALSAFETWHVESRGVPFWALFEQPMPETPRVDF